MPALLGPNPPPPPFFNNHCTIPKKVDSQIMLGVPLSKQVRLTKSAEVSPSKELLRVVHNEEGTHGNRALKHCTFTNYNTIKLDRTMFYVSGSQNRMNF